MLGIEVGQLRQLDDEVVNSLGLQSIGDCLRNQNRKHDRHGICERISKLEHNDCKGDGGALGEIQWLYDNKTRTGHPLSRRKGSQQRRP